MVFLLQNFHLLGISLWLVVKFTSNFYVQIISAFFFPVYASLWVYKSIMSTYLVFCTNAFIHFWDWSIIFIKIFDCLVVIWEAAFGSNTAETKICKQIWSGYTLPLISNICASLLKSTNCYQCAGMSFRFLSEIMLKSQDLLRAIRNIELSLQPEILCISSIHSKTAISTGEDSEILLI